ncbi:MAG TPA: multicopper oxidase family protein [Casimicrobiaceae bacterium]
MMRTRRRDRRRFLGVVAAGIGSALVGCGDGSGPQDPPAISTATPQLYPEGQSLRSIAPLRNDSEDPSRFEATLVATQESASLVPGVATPMFLYNGRSPGPLIELREGQHVRIRLDNRLAQETTVHWHGLPVPPDQDGNPMDPVAAGATRVYEFDVEPGTAGTYWYHPHPHDATASQVARGLAAPLVVRAADDPLADIPEVLMFVTGVKLDAAAQIAADDPIDWTVGRQQEKLLVNGARLPVHSAAPGSTERWRIFNATASSHLKLSLEGHAFTLVGTDGGLLGAPVEGLNELLLAPAQRVELIVRANPAPNGRYRLRALRFETDFLNLGTYQDQDLLTLVTTNALPLPARAVPSSLRPIADLGTPSARQRVELDEVNGLCTRTGAKTAFLINGQIFDMNRVDLVTSVGRVELWDVVNKTAMAHPFHIHGTQFQLVSRQIGTEVTPAPYLAWIDTVLVPSQQAVTIKTRQTLPGRRMFHCHILEHEDNCMMAILDVQSA